MAEYFPLRIVYVSGVPTIGEFQPGDTVPIAAGGTGYTNINDFADFVFSSLDHGSLPGLSDNDHPQYLLKTVFNSLSGGWQSTRGTVLSYSGGWESTRQTVLDNSSTWGTGGGGGGVTDHSGLSGLSANDHPQYVLSSTNQGLSSLVTSVEGSTVSLSSYIAANEAMWSADADVSTLSGLGDTNITNLSANQIIVYDGSSWVNEYNDKTEMRVRNGTASAMSKGDVIAIENAHNQNLVNVILADASQTSAMPALGILDQDLAVGEEGIAITFGKAQGLNTSGLTEGATAYVSPTTPGTITTTKPTSEGHLIQNIGIVMFANAFNGAIKVTGIGRANDIDNVTRNNINDLSTLVTSIETSTVDLSSYIASNETTWSTDNDTTDHTALSNIGTNTHAQIDSHIADSSLHFTEASIDHGSIAGLGDNDHPQYLLSSTYSAASGNWESTYFVVNSLSASWEESADITYVSSVVDTNTANITANDGDITYLSGVVAQNIIDIGTNATDIGSNTALIGTNASNITANDNDITYLSGVVATNASNHSSHTGDATIHFTEASIDHGSIGGLADNDHPQYLLSSTYSVASGNWESTYGTVNSLSSTWEPETAAEILAKLLTVDGAGSNLDADKLDGEDSYEYIQHDTYVQPFNPFGNLASDKPRKIYASHLTDRFLGRESEIYVAKNGTEIPGGSKANLFDGAWDTVAITESAGGSDFTVSVDMSAYGLTNSNGFTYSDGFFILGFYSGRSASGTPTGVYYDRNNTSGTLSFTKESTQGSHALAWRITGMPYNYLVKFDITIPANGSGGNDIWISTLEYHGSRMGKVEGPLIDVAGGSFYGEINGELQGVKKWYIQQDGDAEFRTLTINGASQVVDTGGNWTGNNLDHTTDLDNVGTNTHAQIDSHIASGSVHFTEASIDHGSIAGLADNDHPQYVLSSTNQALSSLVTSVEGSTVSLSAYIASNEAVWSSDADVSTLSGLGDTAISSPTNGQSLNWNGTAWVNTTPTTGVTDHGLLTGLSDNDHPQYLLSSTYASTSGVDETADYDFSSTEFHVHSGTVNINWSGTNGPSGANRRGKLNVRQDSILDPAITLYSDDDGADAAPILEFNRESASPTTADYLGQLKWIGNSDSGTKRTYAKITGKIDESTNTSEGGLIEFMTRQGGSNLIMARFKDNTFRTLNGVEIWSSGDVEINTSSVSGTMDNVKNHIASGSVHFTEASIDHGSIAGLGDNDHPQYVLSATNQALSSLVTSVETSTVSLSSYIAANETTWSTDNDTTDHTALSNIGTNTHAQIDTHIADSTIHFTEASIDHTNISNIGTNTHAQIDTHISDTNTSIGNLTTSTVNLSGYIAANETTWATDTDTTDHTALTNIGTNTHAQIDTHIADSTIHFTEASIDHTNITNIGTNTHAQIDTHISNHTTSANTWNGTYHTVFDNSGTWGTGGGTSDHGALTGLADNDHPQYVLSSTNAALSSLVQDTTDVSGIVHGNLSALDADDHTQYARVDGTRNIQTQTISDTYTGTVGDTSIGYGIETAGNLTNKAGNYILLSATTGYQFRQNGITTYTNTALPNSMRNWDSVYSTVNSTSGTWGGGGGGGVAAGITVVNTGTDNINTAGALVPLDVTAGYPAYGSYATDYSYTAGNSYVTINTAGTYEVTFNVAYTSTVQRWNGILKIYKGTGGAAPSSWIGYGASKHGYLRSASGHNEASLIITCLVTCSANDTIGGWVAREAANGTCSLVANETYMTIKRMS